MRLICLSLILLSLTCFSLWAEITSYYTFSQETHPYTSITGTVLPTLQADDAIDSLDIGFDFPYISEVYSYIKISANGWIGLGNGFDNPEPVNNLASAINHPVLAPLWDDLSMASGDVSYLRSGTSPQRVLTVQYHNARWNYSAVNQYNFQIKLYETGRIELCYGTASGNAINPTASIGINMSPGGGGNYYSVTVANPATVSTTIENWHNMSFPANGTVYAFNPIPPVPNDLMVVSITGSRLVEQGVSAVYTVSVRNFGTEGQNNYTVKLMEGTTELASVNGSYIAPLQLTTFEIPWTPAASGERNIYGKVVLPGDATPNNDQTSLLGVMVYPAGYDAVTVGTGDETARIPYDFYWRNNLYETLYFPAEINTIGYIYGITLYKPQSQSVLDFPAMQMWLGETTLTDLSQNWIPSTQLTQVVNYIISFPENESLINITFDTPYYYTGGNLVMMAYHMHNCYCAPVVQFQSQTIGTNRARRFYSDATTANPAAPPAPTAGQLSGQFPKTTFIIQPVSVGQLSGTVTDTNAQPVSGATLSIMGTNQTCQTSAAGTYSFANVPVGNQEVSVAKTGFTSQTQHVIITQNQTTTLNFTLVGAPYVNVTGRVVRADNPSIGIAGATVFLDADSFYNTGTNAQGYFTFTNVESNRNYVYSAIAVGYESIAGTVDIGYVDYDFGNLALNIGFVAVNGRIIHALDNTFGVREATVTLTGDETYTTITSPLGYFLFESVQTNSWYNYTVTKAGYAPLSDSIFVGYENYNMQNLDMFDLIQAPIPGDMDVIGDHPYLVFLHWTFVERRAGNSADNDDTEFPDNNRSMGGTNVYRLLAGQENNEASWDSLGYNSGTDNTFITAITFPSFGQINYVFAIKCRYTGGLLSPPAFFDVLPVGNLSGRIQGTVRNAVSNAPIRNITLHFSPGDSTAVTGATGLYDQILLQNTYTISITHPDYEPYDTTGIVINNLDDITFDILLTPITGNPEDNHTPALTGLTGCYPNPFKNTTTIEYTLKNDAVTEIGIYNLKGQLVRTLHNAYSAQGRHSLVWDGTDRQGNPVSGGIYYLRMQTDNSSSTRKLLLLK